MEPQKKLQYGRFFKRRGKTLRIFKFCSDVMEKIIAEYQKVDTIHFPEFSFLDMDDSYIFQIPESIETVFFGDKCNIPLSIKNLRFGDFYNEPLNNLPIGLKMLHLGHYYNKPLDYLPVSLEILILGNYNCSLENLPDSLRFLVLTSAFKSRLDAIPSFITFLSIGLDYDHNSKELVSKKMKVYYNEINGLRIIVADEYKYLNEVRDRFNLYIRCADDLGLEIDFIR